MTRNETIELSKDMAEVASKAIGKVLKAVDENLLHAYLNENIPNYDGIKTYGLTAFGDLLLVIVIDDKLHNLRVAVEDVLSYGDEMIRVCSRTRTAVGLLTLSHNYDYTSLALGEDLDAHETIFIPRDDVISLNDYGTTSFIQK